MIRASLSRALLSLFALGLLSCEPKKVSTDDGNPPHSEPGAKILTVTLNADHTASIADSIYTLDELKRHLKVEGGDVGGIRLEVASSHPVSDVMSVLESLKEAGIDSITIAEPDPAEGIDEE